jgi:predicted membrane-bound spermidine synthase
MIFLIVLLEGFVTISAEILTIRQLMPFVGSSVVVTSLIIGVFLLFLAYGYRTGGRLESNHAKVLMRNMLCSAALLGVGLSYVFIETWFSFFKFLGFSNSLVPLISYLLVVTAPLVYLLGQTVPLTLHLFPDAQQIKTGLLGGRILHVNTLGSFFGAVLTSVLLLSVLGVAWTVTINAVILLTLALFMFANTRQLTVCLGVLLLVLPLTLVLNVYIEQSHFLKTNHYANYRISTVQLQDEPYKRFEVNNTAASMLSSDGRGYPYVELMKSILMNDLALHDKDILVLGAGGFTLSLNDQQNNRFTYVDIDPAVESLAQENFSGPVNGQFVAQDARTYLNTVQERYHVVIMDVYSNPLGIPQHLLTAEYFESLVQVLKPGGVVLMNIIANPQFPDVYAQRVDRTIRSVLGYCTSQPSSYKNDLTNLVYVCYPEHREQQGIYTDNLNTSTLDAFIGVRHAQTDSHS